MAMIKCPDCGTNVSDRAQACPNCGFPIQEEVERIRRDSEEKQKEWEAKLGGSVTDKDIALQLVEAIIAKDIETSNLCQSILREKYGDSLYSQIVEEAVQLEADDSEKNQFMIKNISMLALYLDYPLDKNGFRNWYFDTDEDKQKRGFYQVIGKTEDLLKYYTQTNTMEVHYITGSLLGGIPRDFSRRIPPTYVLLCRYNVEEYGVLEQKSEEYLKARTKSFNISVRNNHRIQNEDNWSADSYCFITDDLVFITEDYGIEKEVIDTVAIAGAKLHAVASMLTFERDESKPFSVGTNAAIGAGIGGTAGAVIGYASGVEQERQYQEARAYNQQLRNERAEAIARVKAINEGQVPTKMGKVNRLVVGIVGYFGIFPMTFDSDEHNNHLVEYTVNNTVLQSPYNIDQYIGDKREFASVQADVYLKEGLLIESGIYDSIYVEFYGQGYSVKQIQAIIISSIKEKINKSTSIKVLTQEIAELQKIDNRDETKKIITEAQEKIKALELEILEANNYKEYKRATELAMSVNEDDLQEAIDIFAQLGEWKDSKIRLEENKVKLEKIVTDRCLKEQRKKRIRITALACSCMAIVLIVLGYFINKNVLVPNKIYNSGIEMMKEGQYDEAIATFASLNGYKDADEQIMDCLEAKREETYLAALDFKNSGKYENAIAIFESLGDYKDSKKLIGDCYDDIDEEKYQAAMALKDSGRYEDAITAFESMNGYKDSKELINVCIEQKKEEIYNEILLLISEKKYDLAKPLFEEIRDYKDINDIYESVARQGIVGYKYQLGDYEWLVLAKEDNRVLLITTNVIFERECSDKTWEESPLRKYLNGSFYDSFSDIEKENILTVHLSTEDYEYRGRYFVDGGNDTDDKIFLLSKTELDTFFAEGRECDGPWWLRTPGMGGTPAFVLSTGQVDDRSQVGFWSISRGVRPALWYKLE